MCPGNSEETNPSVLYLPHSTCPQSLPPSPSFLEDSPFPPSSEDSPLPQSSPSLASTSSGLFLFWILILLCLTKNTKLRILAMFSLAYSIHLWIYFNQTFYECIIFIIIMQNLKVIKSQKKSHSLNKTNSKTNNFLINLIYWKFVKLINNFVLKFFGNLIFLFCIFSNNICICGQRRFLYC